MPELLAFNLSGTGIGMKKELKMPELILYRSKVAVRHVRSGTALRHGFQHASHGVSFLDGDAQLNRMGSLLGSCRKLSRKEYSLGVRYLCSPQRVRFRPWKLVASFNKKAKSNRNRTGGDDIFRKPGSSDRDQVAGRVRQPSPATGHCLHCTPCTTLRLLLEF